MENLLTTSERKPRPGRPTQSQAADKRRRILEAARDLFLLQGYADVSIRSIAERAEVSTRTVFNLFEDKATLFAICLESISGGMMEPALVEGETPERTLELFAVKMLAAISEPMGLRFARLVMRDGSEIPELAAAGLESQHRQFVRPLAEYLEKLGHEDGESLAKIFIAMIIAEWNRSVTFCLPLPGADEHVFHARRIAKIFTAGIAMQ
jgi:AcrR family transcriptional regulator